MNQETALAASETAIQTHGNSGSQLCLPLDLNSLQSKVQLPGNHSNGHCSTEHEQTFVSMSAPEERQKEQNALSTLHLLARKPLSK